MVTLRERLSARARARRQAIPPRAVRVAKAPRSATAATVVYSLRLRQVVSAWRRRALVYLEPVARRFSEIEQGQEAPSTKALVERLKKDASLLAGTGALAHAISSTGQQVLRHNRAEFDRLGIAFKPKAKPGLRLDDKEAPKGKPGLGIKLEPELRPQIESWRDKNVDLITGALHAQADKVADLLHTHEGSRWEVIAARLEERFGVAGRRAELIARDQVLTLNSQINAARMKAAGINRYVWTTTGDERVRGDPDGLYPDSDQDHHALDGQTFSWDDPPVTNPKTGARAHPGEDINCRCTAYPVLEELGEGEGGGSGGEEPPPPPKPPEPPSAPLPEEPQRPRTVIARKAIELRAALTRRTGTDEVKDAAAARRIMREHVAETLPRARTKDVDRVGGTSFKTNSKELRRLGANGVHDWDGTIQVTPQVLSHARETLDAVAAGKFEASAFRAASAYERHILRGKADGLRTLLHEEIHGHSRVTVTAYGARHTFAARVIEEVGVELNARKALLNAVGPGPFFAGALDGVPGSYQKWIDAVVDLVKPLGLSGVESLEAIAGAFERAILADGTAFTAAEAFVDAWASELPGTPDQRRDILAGLLEQFRRQ